MSAYLNNAITTPLACFNVVPPSIVCPRRYIQFFFEKKVKGDKIKLKKMSG
jgi:hypothetical protein